MSNILYIYITYIYLKELNKKTKLIEWFNYLYIYTKNYEE